MPDQDPSEEKSGGEQPNVSVDPKSEVIRNCDTETKPKHDAASQHQESAIKLEQDLRDGERWLISIGVASVLVNLLIAWIYYGQLGEMRKSTKAATDAVVAAQQSGQSARDAIRQARDQFKDEQRPYLWLTNNGFGNPDFLALSAYPGHGQILWTYHISNYGKSPARDVGLLDWIKIDDGPFVLSYGMRQQGSHSGPIPPGGEIIATVISSRITSREFAADTSPTKQGGTISIRAHIVYSDSYGANYETGICLTKLNAGNTAFCRDAAENYVK
ncbi:MAG: hypothetical protein WB992_23460 [Bryobacteraceae bacterium]